MSEFAFFRFRSHNMLTNEEVHKEEIVQLTEDVLQAKGIQCDASISRNPPPYVYDCCAKVFFLLPTDHT